MSLQGEVRELELEVEKQVHDRVVSEMNQNVTHMMDLMTTMLGAWPGRLDLGAGRSPSVSGQGAMCTPHPAN